MLKNYILFFLILFGTVTATPQAVVFDFGGVMTGPAQPELVRHFISTSLKISPLEYMRAAEEKRKALRQGMNDEQFWSSYACRKGIVLPKNWPEQLKSVMKQAIGVNPEMYTLVEELKAQNYQVALLSNIDKRLLNIVRELSLYEPFSPCLLSHEIGIEKPHLNAYRILLQELNLPGCDVIFIDDRLENVEAARKLEIDAIWFRSPLQLRQELEVRGIYTH